jgi:DedD protein
MDEAAKRRLVGAAVLVALAVIFVPMLVEEGGEDEFGDPIVIPEPPSFDADAEVSDRAAGASDDAALPDPDDLALPLPTPEPPGAATDRVEPPASASGSRSAVDAEGAARSTTRDRTRAAREPSPQPEPSALAEPGPKPIPSGVSAWVVQVASLGSPEAARGLQNELRAKGYPAFVEQAEVGGRRYYRVRVGPEVERARADSLAKRLAGETGSQPLVQRYP